MRFKIFIPFFFFLAYSAALFSQSSESLLIDFAVVKTQYPGETPQRCIAAVKDNQVIMRDLYADGSAGPLMYYDLSAGLHYECRQEKRRDLALRTAFPLPLPLTLHEDTLKAIAGYACQRAFAHIGADSKSGLIHTVRTTTAKVADCAEAEHLLHGEEERVFGDRGYDY